MRYLPFCDLVLVFENGQVTEVGHFEELIENDGDFAKFFVKHMTETMEAEQNEVEDELRNTKADKDLLATIEKQ